MVKINDISVTEPKEMPPSETVRIDRRHRWVKPLLLALAGISAGGVAYGVYSWFRGFSPPPPKEPTPIVEPYRPIVEPYRDSSSIIPPVISLETPKPMPTATPTTFTPTNEQILERELFSLPDYTRDEAQALLAEAKADGKVTPWEVTSVLSIVRDPLFLVVARNDDLTYKFVLQNYTSLLRELREASYAQELVKRLSSANLKENVSEAWNYKVRREDEVLCVIVPKNQSGFDCNSDEARQFREDNGSYHLKLWSDGNSILPLDNNGLKEWFEKKEDAEHAMGQMWVPDAMPRYDITKWQFILMDYAGTRIPVTPFEALKNNMDTISGKKKINGRNVTVLTSFKDLKDRIVQVRDNHSLKSYPRHEVFENDFDEAMFKWARQIESVPQSGLIKVPELYRTHIISVLEQNWKDLELVKLAYGLAMLDMKDVESADTIVSQVYSKALGYVMMNQDGRVPTNIGDRQYAALVVHKKKLSLIRQKQPRLIVYKGQSVSPYSIEEGLREDGVHYVRTPNGADVVWKPN